MFSKVMKMKIGASMTTAPMISQGGIAAQNLFISYRLPFIPGSLRWFVPGYLLGNWIPQVDTYDPLFSVAGQ
jgi:hypothetical protein